MKYLLEYKDEFGTMLRAIEADNEYDALYEMVPESAVEARVYRIGKKVGEYQKAWVEYKDGEYK